MTHNQQMMKKWIVLYVKGGRFASFEHTPENMADIKRQVYMGLIQRDVTGTEHYACTPRKRVAKAEVR